MRATATGQRPRGQKRRRTCAKRARWRTSERRKVKVAAAARHASKKDSISRRSRWKFNLKIPLPCCRKVRANTRYLMARAVHFRPLRDAQGNFRLRKVVLLVSRQMIPADSLSFRHGGVLPLPDPPVCDIFNYSLLRRN